MACPVDLECLLKSWLLAKRFVHVHRKAWSLCCLTSCPLSSAASATQPHTPQLTGKPVGSLDVELLGTTKVGCTCKGGSRAGASW